MYLPCTLCLKIIPRFLNGDFSSAVSALRYTPGTSKMDTYIPSCDSSIILVNRSSKDMVGDDSSSLGIYHLFGLPYEHIPPFNFPYIFSFIKFVARSAPPLFRFLSLSGSSDPITFIYSIWVYSLYRDAIYR